MRSRGEETDPVSIHPELDLDFDSPFRMNLFLFGLHYLGHVRAVLRECLEASAQLRQLVDSHCTPHHPIDRSIDRFNDSYRVGALTGSGVTSGRRIGCDIHGDIEA